LHCSQETFAPWQLVTSGFLHSGFSHILFNMWGLYLFGSLVLPHIGQKKFIWLYLIGVLTGNIIFLATGWGSYKMLIGASGAVCAMMMAAATLEPERKFVMIFMPFTPLKTTTLVICFAIVEILLQLSGKDSGVAHLAHLGGLVGGYLFIRIGFAKQVVWDIFRKQVRDIPRTPPPDSGRRRTGSVTSAELDALLDKVSREGINSLSEYELSRLRQAREEMRGTPLHVPAARPRQRGHLQRGRLLAALGYEGPRGDPESVP
jgi:membrane associated rhomboid family serine protease